MSFTYNRVILIGRAAAAPEVRFTPGGQRVASCNVATDRPTRAGATPTADWHRIVCFDRLAEIAAEHLTKGRLVLVEGAITYRTWQDQQGSKHTTTDILARELILLDRPPNEVKLGFIYSSTDSDTLLGTLAPSALKALVSGFDQANHEECFPYAAHIQQWQS